MITFVEFSTLHKRYGWRAKAPLLLFLKHAYKDVLTYYGVEPADVTPIMEAWDRCYHRYALHVGRQPDMFATDVDHCFSLLQEQFRKLDSKQVSIGDYRSYYIGGLTGCLGISGRRTIRDFGEVLNQCPQRKSLLPIYEDLLHPAMLTQAELAFDSYTPAGQQALAVYADVRASGRYSDLPVLADALEDAGERRQHVLDHLRGPGPHYEGCWAMNDVLPWYCKMGRL